MYTRKWPPLEIWKMLLKGLSRCYDDFLPLWNIVCFGLWCSAIITEGRRFSCRMNDALYLGHNFFFVRKQSLFLRCYGKHSISQQQWKPSDEIIDICLLAGKCCLEYEAWYEDRRKLTLRQTTNETNHWVILFFLIKS